MLSDPVSPRRIRHLLAAALITLACCGTLRFGGGCDCEPFRYDPQSAPHRGQHRGAQGCSDKSQHSLGSGCGRRQ